MSDVNATDVTRIDSPEDVLGLYGGAGRDSKAGIEIELAFFDPEKPGLAPMGLTRNRLLKNSAMNILPEAGDWVHNEPTAELLEIASIPGTAAQIKDVLDDTNRKIAALSEKAQDLGLKRSYFSDLPDKTADELLAHIVDVERYNIMYAPYRADMKDCVRYFAVCKSNQVSVSPKNPDQMLSDVRRLYCLAPFLFMLTDNTSAFSEGQIFKGHAGMHLRHEGLGQGRGGIPPYVFTARNGKEFIRAHIHHAMNNPLFMYYDLDGTLTRVPSGDWSVTFNTLKEHGLNTASNYYLAQSLLWPDVKIAALKDEAGAVTGHRYEARMFGVGIHQHQSAFLIVAGLAFQRDLAENVDELLRQYGFDADDLPAMAAHVSRSYKAARAHNGKFFDIAYGTGTMAAFARDFADLMENACDDPELEDALAPLLTICRTGCTDAKVNRALFPTLADIAAIQKNYDPEIFDNPNRCARQVFEKQLKTLKGTGACQCAHA